MRMLSDMVVNHPSSTRQFILRKAVLPQVAPHLQHIFRLCAPRTVLLNHVPTAVFRLLACSVGIRDSCEHFVSYFVPPNIKAAEQLVGQWKSLVWTAALLDILPVLSQCFVSFSFATVEGSNVRSNIDIYFVLDAKPSQLLADFSMGP
jgi:hypothetical protein